MSAIQPLLAGGRPLCGEKLIQSAFGHIRDQYNVILVVTYMKVMYSDMNMCHIHTGEYNKAEREREREKE